jgi:pimeloyl-ACP methyl ester carboxylesterase
MRTELLPTSRGLFGVRRAGPADAPMVFFVHAFPDDASTWDGLVVSLASAGYQSAAIYLRGYHPSPLTGSLALDDLVDDLVAVVDGLAPCGPTFLVGHDYGAQLGYALLARARVPLFAAAVLLAGAHAESIARNTRRHPRQLWFSRYLVFFHLGPLADHIFARRDFAAVDRLWRRWAPGLVESGPSQCSCETGTSQVGTSELDLPGSFDAGGGRVCAGRSSV